MGLVLGALNLGLILSFLGFGVYLSFKVINFPDLTADGSFTLGAAVTALFLVSGYSPVTACVAGMGSGLLAGLATGLLHVRAKIKPLLAGILVMTGLYTVNLRVMGRSNISLLQEKTFYTFGEPVLQLPGGMPHFRIWGMEFLRPELYAFLLNAALVLVVGFLLYGFLKTELGLALRATGDNPVMIRSLGAHLGKMKILALMLSNGMIAFSGSLLAQYQGFSDVQMGFGMIVFGFAIVVVGEALAGKGGTGPAILGLVAGSLLFRLLAALALRCGLHPYDLKLATAAFLLMALLYSKFLASALGKRRKARLDP